MQTLLVTVDSLRYEAFLEHMPVTLDALDWVHSNTFSTGCNTGAAFPAIIGGEYPHTVGLPPGTSVARELSTFTAGVSTNHLLTPKYGYDEGFDEFSSPGDDGDTLKDRARAHLSQGTVTYKIAVRMWNLFERVRPSGFTPSFRPAGEVVADFEGIRSDRDDWFIWLHFMEPHHPYEPPTVRDRLEARQLSRSVIGGTSTDPDLQERVRLLYRQEVAALDQALSSLWEVISDETRVIFCADHGELLGEDGRWGHPGCFIPEVFHVPLGGTNVREPGELASLVDVPSLVLNQDYNRGTLDREVAYVYDGSEWAATDGRDISTPEGTFDLWDNSPATNSRLVRARSSFDVEGSSLEEADTEDLERLGYL